MYNYTSYANKRLGCPSDHFVAGAKEREEKKVGGFIVDRCAFSEDNDHFGLITCSELATIAGFLSDLSHPRRSLEFIDDQERASTIVCLAILSRTC